MFGGSDTFIGGSAPPTIYAVGASSQNVSLVGTPAGTDVVDWNDTSATINAAGASGSDQLYVGGGAGLNSVTSIIFSNAGNDVLTLLNDFTGTGRAVDLSNWHASDSISLFGYTGADQTALSTAISTGAVSVTLSDQTTINFISKSS